MRLDWIVKRARAVTAPHHFFVICVIKAKTKRFGVLSETERRTFVSSVRDVRRI